MKIYAKIAIPVFLAVFVSLVLVGFVSRWYFTKQLFDEIYTERKGAVERILPIVFQPGDFRSPEDPAFQERLQTFIAIVKTGDIVRMTVWDKEDRVLASDLTPLIGQRAVRHPELQTVYTTRQPLFTQKATDNNEPLQTEIQDIHLVLVPIFFEGQFVGAVELHISSAFFESVLSRNLTITLGVISVMGMTALLALLIIVRRIIVQPIQSLAAASERMTKGDFEATVDSRSRDEIGVLTRIFETMRKRLRSNMLEIEAKRVLAEQAERMEREINKKIEIEREELRKFKQTADNSFNHIVITDPDGSILYANRSAEELTGYTIAEMRGKTPALWGKQMDRAFYENFWKTIKVEKQSFAGEIVNRRKDGTRYIADAHVSPILDPEGAVRFFVGIERDVTAEREQQERELQSKTKLETEKARAEGILRYLRSIGEGVYATDRRGMIVFLNDTAAALAGRGIADLVGTSAAQAFQFRTGKKEDAPYILPTLGALSAERAQVFPRGVFLVRSGHDPMPVSGTYAPIIEGKHISGAIVVFQDITQRYELEKMKESFLSIAAHQLRTPLGSMRWSMELLKGGDLGKIPKKAQAALDQLYDNSSRMLTIVNDLLNVSRIDQGRSKEAPGRADLGVLLGEVTTAMQGAINEKNLKFDLHVPKMKLPQPTVSRKHLFEAFENLIANAVRYTPEGGSIKVALHKEKDELVVLIADTGIGIPEADQKKIFSKFFRAANAVQYFTDGSGLGLSVVKSYIEENGGSVSFVSQQNIGTTFTVRLPIEPKKLVILS